jgi:hypothetical protein
VIVVFKGKLARNPTNLQFVGSSQQNNMKTGDLYQIMMSTVCRHTGVGELDMIENNKEECVDARYILIYFLSKYLTDEDISKNTGLTRQAVNYIRNHFENKMNKWSIKSGIYDIGEMLKPPFLNEGF